MLKLKVRKFSGLIPTFVEVTWEKLVALRNHKDNFQNNSKFRLAKPVKSEIGIISQHYIENTNKNVRRGKNVSQWRQTKEVISWFQGTKDKEKSFFPKFKIARISPPILKDLLANAIKYAITVVTIEKKVTDTIIHSRKLLLLNNYETG